LSNLFDPFTVTKLADMVNPSNGVKNERYITYVLFSYLQLKNGKYKPDSAIQQAKMLLSGETKDRVIASMEKCRNAADGTYLDTNLSKKDLYCF
jgi:hypothetical protein